jgi:hypothetical protein
MSELSTTVSPMSNYIFNADSQWEARVPLRTSGIKVSPYESLGFYKERVEAESAVEQYFNRGEEDGMLCVMRLRIISLEKSKERLERKVKKQKSKLRENKAEIVSLNRDNKTLKASLNDVLAEQKRSRTPPPSEDGWEEEEWHSGFRRCPRILNSMNGYDT